MNVAHIVVPVFLLGTLTLAPAASGQHLGQDAVGRRYPVKRDGGIKPCYSPIGVRTCAPGPQVAIRIDKPIRDAPPGGLRLRIEPAFAAVYVDGEYVGPVSRFNGNSERLDLEAGSHFVEIDAPGFESIALELRAHSGRTTEYRATLPSLTFDDH